MEQHDELPVMVRPPLEQQPQVLDLDAPGTTVMPPSQEEVRAAEALFARQEKESAAAGAILTMWTAGMVLPDLVRDMMQSDDDEEEEEKKKRPELPTRPV